MQAKEASARTLEQTPRVGSGPAGWLLGRLGNWMGRWELWLSLGVGAWLRLADLQHTIFLDDQVLLFQVGQAALHDGGLPITGIRSSLGTLNAPFSVYLYLPFAALGDPLVATWLIALANIVAVGLAYLLVDRYFGRVAAGVAVALYATSAWAVLYSRYFWQQTAVAPFLLLFVLTLYAGVVQQRRHWLAPHLLLLGILLQLHPISLYLVPLTLTGLALLWPKIPWRGLLLGLLGIGLLYVPSLLWGIASDWSDVRFLLRHFFDVPATYDLLGLGQLLATLRYQGLLPFGPSVPWIGLAMDGLYLLALAWLCWRVGAPLLRALRQARKGERQHFRRLRELPLWRSEALLVVWQVVPLLLMIHRTQSYCECYMVVFFPGPYITIGLALAWLFRRLLAQPATGWWKPLRFYRHPPRPAFWRALACSSLTVLVLGQALASTHLVTTYRGLDTLEASLGTARQTAQAVGASHTVVASSLFLFGPFTYVAGREPGGLEVQSAENCLALPLESGGPTVVLTALDQPHSLVDAVLSHLTQTTPLRTVPVRDLPPDHLYRVDGDPAISYEQLLASPWLAGQHLRLEGMATLPEQPEVLVLRWRVVQPLEEPIGPEAQPLRLHFALQPSGAAGVAPDPALSAVCRMPQLALGTTLLVWFQRPPLLSAARLMLSVRQEQWARVEPTPGQLRFVTGSIMEQSSQVLPLTCAPDQPPRPVCPLP